jgi:putative transposase
MVQVDEAKIRGHVDEVVRSSVEATLNGLLDAEADDNVLIVAHIHLG